MPYLIKKLESDFPEFKFKISDKFLWSFRDKTISYIDSPAQEDCSLLLHELSHAVLGHSQYNHDIELLVMEREAWNEALNIAPKYDVLINDDFIQSNLDTYRDWLHKRSTCPNCDANGLQSKKNQYTCIICSHIWTVNEARTCALRRYKK